MNSNIPRRPAPIWAGCLGKVLLILLILIAIGWASEYGYGFAMAGVIAYCFLDRANRLLEERAQRAERRLFELEQAMSSARQTIAWLEQRVGEIDP